MSLIKQASRQWFHKFTECLTGYGFKQSIVDNSLFTLQISTSFITLVCCVDFILAGDNEDAVIQDYK